MIFFFKKTEIHVDCFTSSGAAFKYFPIDYAKKFIPDWWLKVPKTDPNTFFPRGTMKTCSGIIEYYKKGLIMPVWSDLCVNISPVGTHSYRWAFADGYTGAITATDLPDMTPMANDGEYFHLKIDSEWLLYCKDNLKWIFMDPMWNKNNKDYSALPGVVDYYQNHSTAINLFFHRGEKEKTIMINAGTPMTHMIPITEKKLVMHKHFITPEEFTRKHQEVRRFAFSNWQQKKNQICPYHKK